MEIGQLHWHGNDLQVQVETLWGDREDVSAQNWLMSTCPVYGVLLLHVPVDGARSSSAPLPTCQRRHGHGYSSRGLLTRPSEQKMLPRHDSIWPLHSAINQVMNHTKKIQVSLHSASMVYLYFFPAPTTYSCCDRETGKRSANKWEWPLVRLSACRLCWLHQARQQASKRLWHTVRSVSLAAAPDGLISRHSNTPCPTVCVCVCHGLTLNSHS